MKDARETWEEQAETWADFARSPGHDHFFWEFNGPRFLDLVPPPGRCTLDVACGEGRLGRLLAEHGHRVVGIDRSLKMTRLADEAGDQSLAVGDAAALPIAAGAVDLAVAFMSLQDIVELDASVREVARTLIPGGRFCVAIAHPLRSAGGFETKDADSRFAVRDYFETRPWDWSTQHTGLRMTLPGIHRPLGAYTGALERAGFEIEILREPRPTQEQVARYAESARWTRLPCFLHLRAVLRAPAAGREGGP